MTGRQEVSAGTVTGPAAGREAQRRRTRRAVVQAAQDFLRSGTTTPSVDEVAAAADVSRRTVYAYFPTLDQLLLDATLGLLAEAEVEPALDALPGADPVERVLLLVRTVHRQSAATLPLGRRLLRLTAEGGSAGSGGGAAPRRGYRRVAWVERACEPLRAQLDEQAWQRLVSGLASLVGWEALLVLTDVRGLDGPAAEEVVLWSARALVTSALAGA